MKTFEIHITGDESINDVLTAMNIKNIIVELLHPDGTSLRTEYMSSFVEKHLNYNDCYDRILALATKLKSEHNIDIIRVKIECPYYEEYVPKSKYIESHFIPKDSKYPISRNKRSGKLMGTDREYDSSKYQEFIEKWQGEDVELCVFDTFVEEDFDWMNLYKN